MKQTTTEQLARIDLKVTGNIAELNTRVNSLSDKISTMDEVISNSKLRKVDSIFTECKSQTSTLASKVISLEKQISSCERKNEELAKAVSFMNKQFEEFNKLSTDRDFSMKRLNVRLDNSDICQSRIGTRMDSLEAKSISFDTRHRRMNLIFEGISESPNEYTKGVISNIFNSSGGLANPADIDIAYRLGKSSDNHTRPILVAFHKLEAKDNVLKNAVKIKQSAKLPNLWINRDHPDLTRRQSANTRRCYNLMRANNHKCTLQGTSITYAGKVYQYKELNNLPIGSRLEDTRLIECNDGQGICFQTELAYLSNFYNSPFYYKDKLFVSAEQAFQWAKAVAADYHYTAKQMKTHMR